jgi:hypothetical protein
MSDVDKSGCFLQNVSRMLKHAKQLSFPLSEMALILSYCEMMAKAQNSGMNRNGHC